MPLVARLTSVDTMYKDYTLTALTFHQTNRTERLCVTGKTWQERDDATEAGSVGAAHNGGRPVKQTTYRGRS